MTEVISAIIKGAGVCSTVYKLFNENDHYTKINQSLDKLIDSHLVAGIILLNKIAQSTRIENQILLSKEAHKEFVLAQAMYETYENKYLTSLEYTALCEIILKEPHMAIKTLDTIAILYYKQTKMLMLASSAYVAFTFSLIKYGIIPAPMKPLLEVCTCQKNIAQYYDIDINDLNLESHNCLTRLTQLQNEFKI